MKSGYCRKSQPFRCSLSRVLKGIFLGTALAAVLASAQSSKTTAVQVNIDSLLNARVVITAHDGQLQVANHALDSGDVSILITQTASEVSASGKLTALPDSDLFAANERHPAVKLHYAQPDGGAQVHRSAERVDTYSFAVPSERYAQMQLFFISAQGATPLSARLFYADGSSEKRSTRVPDFYFLPTAEDKGWFVLADDLGKVDRKGKMTEATHHYIHGFDLNPDPTRKLLKVEVSKEDSESILNFFGATGVLAQSK